jgi:hypothetical protein
MTLAHEPRADEERAGLDVDRHWLWDATVLLDEGEALVIPVDDDGYDAHHRLMDRLGDRPEGWRIR